VGAVEVWTNGTARFHEVECSATHDIALPWAPDGLSIVTPRVVMAYKLDAVSRHTRLAVVDLDDLSARETDAFLGEVGRVHTLANGLAIEGWATSWHDDHLVHRSHARWIVDANGRVRDGDPYEHCPSAFYRERARVASILADLETSLVVWRASDDEDDDDGDRWQLVGTGALAELVGPDGVARGLYTGSGRVVAVYDDGHVLVDGGRSVGLVATQLHVGARPASMGMWGENDDVERGDVIEA
jgi:hypothetical protein